MLEERWVQIEDYPNYLVSDRGSVKNQITDRVLKPGDNGAGYLYVNLHNEFGVGRFYVHRLVASYFLRVEDPFLEVNHKDGNKANCSVDNLEWVDRFQNIQHAFRTGLNGATFRDNVRPILVVETGDVFESAAACARAIGGRQSTIHKIVNGIGRSHLGYTFQYADEQE